MVCVRAIEYRRLHDIRDLIGTAVIIQAMVFGNMGATSGSGVAFTRDPVTGEDSLYIDFMFNSQGEDIVSGRHTPRNTEKLKQIMPKVYKEIQAIKSRLDKIVRTRLSSPSNLNLLCKGISANHGVAVGKVALDLEVTTNKAAQGEPFILVRQDISTDDIAGIAVCSGLVTNQGGRTSHAAVVARQMDKVCIVGCHAISIDLTERSCTIDKHILHEGDYVTLDGNNGSIYEGKVNVAEERPIDIIEEIEKWKKMSKPIDYNNPNSN
jgi:pyruvate,orthophosphate dikinase